MRHPHPDLRMSPDLPHQGGSPEGSVGLPPTPLPETGRTVEQLGVSLFLCLLVAILTLAMPQSAGAVSTGQETVLVVLATPGEHPYAQAEVERTMVTAGDFLRRASLGQLQLRSDVTPWLAAFGNDPGCSKTALAAAELAAQRNGYDASRYDDVIYVIAGSRCGFQGATWGHEVMLARKPTLQLIVHELGHSFGLAHAQSQDCPVMGLGCGLYDTGDPYSPMGSGSLDFSVYEKAVLGWIRPQPRISSPGRYIVAPPTIETNEAQALVIRTAQGTWWVEYRSRPFRGLLVRLVYPTPMDSPFAPPAVLIMHPTSSGQPWIALGESFRLPGSMRVTLLNASPHRAEILLSRVHLGSRNG